MPTGYTAGLESGEITTLRGYALTCAHAFWNLSDADAVSGNTGPDALVADTTFLDNQLRDAADTIQALLAVTNQQIESLAIKDYRDAAARREALLAAQKFLCERYVDMRARVWAWDPPDELGGLRDFMLQQIDISMPDRGYEYPVPVQQSGGAWLQKKLEDAARIIKDMTARRMEIIQSTAEKNAWLTALRASLENQG